MWLLLGSKEPRNRRWPYPFHIAAAAAAAFATLLYTTNYVSIRALSEFKFSHFSFQLLVDAAMTSGAVRIFSSIDYT